MWDENIVMVKPLTYREPERRQRRRQALHLMDANVCLTLYRRFCLTERSKPVTCGFRFLILEDSLVKVARLLYVQPSKYVRIFYRAHQ